MSSRFRRSLLGRPSSCLVLALALSACGGEQAVARQAPADQDPVRFGSVEARDPVDVDIDEDFARSLSAAFRSASRRALPSVVYISVERSGAAVADVPVPDLFRRFFEFGDPVPRSPAPPRVGSGSGFVIDGEGHVVTNHHVVADAERVQVRSLDGREFEAEVVGSDPSTDIALLRLIDEPVDLPPADLGDSDQVLVGDWVLALGNPLGLEFTVTSGIVSAKGRQITGGALAVESFIQTDAAINPGNSGGPLIDLSGRVVGVNTAIFGSDRFVGYGFAVPIALALEVIDDLREYGHARRPRLGVRVSDVTAVDAEAYGLDAVRGAEVNSVEPDSPARGELEVGDVVLELDGAPIDDANTLVASLARRDPGDEIELTVLRRGSERTIRVELGEFEPESTGRAASTRDDSVEERLGFRVVPLDRRQADLYGHDREDGFLITAVRPYGEAARAGIRQGQLLLAVNGDPVRSVAQFERIAQTVEDRDVMSLRVLDPEIGETIVNYRVRIR